MIEYRCDKCNKLMFKSNKGTITFEEDATQISHEGSKTVIEVKCAKCKHTNKYMF